MLEQPSLEDILRAIGEPNSQVIGCSRQGRDINAHRFGEGPLNISLIAGCHADEPTGPQFLNHLVRFLSTREKHDPLLKDLSWWIVPHANPDGREVNAVWNSVDDTYYDLEKNLQGVVRELPGDDVEFGFPLPPQIGALRPENQAIFDFWKQSQVDFDLHVSLHGMLLSYGPWFLLDQDFIDDSIQLIQACQKEVIAKGYVLHDVDRRGEKGFYRIAEGFGTRPNSLAMREHFTGLNDPEMAQKFHGSSMESIRSLSNNCLTLVTEMPLFIVPRVNHQLVWPDAALAAWSKQFQHWKLLLHKGQINRQQLMQEAHAKGLVAMPVKDQMYFQWFYIWQGIKQCYGKHL